MPGGWEISGLFTLLPSSMEPENTNDLGDSGECNSEEN